MKVWKAGGTEKDQRPPRDEVDSSSPWNVSDSAPMKLGKPKPPPAPDPTPAERRQIQLRAALETLCDSFEKLAREAEMEDMVCAQMVQQRRRIEELHKEHRELNQADALRRANVEEIYKQIGEAEAKIREFEYEGKLRLQLQAIKEEQNALEERIKLSEKELKKGLPLTAKLPKKGDDERLTENLLGNDDGPKSSTLQDDQSPRWIDQGTYETVQILNVLMSSSIREIRLRAAGSIVVLAERSHRAKVMIAEAAGIGETMVALLKSGGLEAIEAIAVLTSENKFACDLFRKHGAVTLLAAYINSETDTAKPNMYDPASGLVVSSDVERPTIVPVTIKSKAVLALRNIATSSPENLVHITQQGGVIPQLVQLMTRMQDEADNASSQGSSRDSSNDSDKGTAKKEGAKKHRSAEEKERRRAERKGKLNESLKNAMQQDMLDRKKLAKDNKRLAEAAGKMLHTLIIKGRKEVKKIIISAIIEQVQRPGSTPPEDVPALMEILRRTAEEQLEIVTSGSDEKALASALQFGRWVKLPALMLGEARNNFKQSQELVKKREAERQRRRGLGLPDDDEEWAHDEILALGHHEFGDEEEPRGKQALQNEAGSSRDGEGRRSDGHSEQSTQRTSRATGRKKKGKAWSAASSRERGAEQDRKRAEQRSEDETRRNKKQEVARAQAKLVLAADAHRLQVALPSSRRAEKFWHNKSPPELQETVQLINKTSAAGSGSHSGSFADGAIGGLSSIPETRKLQYFERDAGPSIAGRDYQLDRLVKSRAATSQLIHSVQHSRVAFSRGANLQLGDSKMADSNVSPLSRSADVWKGTLRAEIPLPNRDAWSRWSEKPRRPPSPEISAAPAAPIAPDEPVTAPTAGKEAWTEQQRLDRMAELAEKLGVERFRFEAQPDLATVRAREGMSAFRRRNSFEQPSLARTVSNR
jgi:hypothetical protein